MNSNGRPTGGYTYKDERQENAVKQSRGGQPPRKKKRRFKPNKDGMLALGALVLIAVIVIILLVLILAAMVYFGVQLYKEASSSAVPSPPATATKPPRPPTQLRKSPSSRHGTRATYKRAFPPPRYPRAS